MSAATNRGGTCTCGHLNTMYGPRPHFDNCPSQQPPSSVESAGATERACDPNGFGVYCNIHKQARIRCELGFLIAERESLKQAVSLGDQMVEEANTQLASLRADSARLRAALEGYMSLLDDLAKDGLEVRFEFAERIITLNKSARLALRNDGGAK